MDMPKFSFADGIALINNRSFKPGSYIKQTSRDGLAYWTLSVNDGLPVFSYTNRRGETRPAKLTEIARLINDNYTNRF